MPKVDLCFQGWVRGANITKATDPSGETVDVSGMDSQELAQKLEDGELAISLGDCLHNSEDAEIELYDFATTKDAEV